MLNSAAAWSLLSNTKLVLRWIGTARAPVDGSGPAPACSASVSKPGSDGPGMGSPVVLRGRRRHLVGAAGDVVVKNCGLYWPDTPPRRGPMKVADILRVKGGTLFTVSPDQPLAHAVRTMAERDIGSLVVMEHGDL